MDPVPDPLLVRKSGSAGDRTRDLCICSQKLLPLDHRGGQNPVTTSKILDAKTEKLSKFRSDVAHNARRHGKKKKISQGDQLPGIFFTPVLALKLRC